MNKSTPLVITISLIQIFDILIHAGTNQIEIIRILSNVIILLWLAISASGKLNLKFSLVPLAFYLFLNIIFLAQNGLTNPQQGGELRIILFVLVISTVLFSGVYIKKQCQR
ncbi:MAG TPA: hypothetical protein DHW49_04075 [Anaerolineae bacterium]|nr:hypothetical protein [Anaerolineae bacterium]